MAARLGSPRGGLVFKDQGRPTTSLGTESKGTTTRKGIRSRAHQLAPASQASTAGSGFSCNPLHSASFNIARADAPDRFGMRIYGGEFARAFVLKNPWGRQRSDGRNSHLHGGVGQRGYFGRSGKFGPANFTRPSYLSSAGVDAHLRV